MPHRLLPPSLPNLLHLYQTLVQSFLFNQSRMMAALYYAALLQYNDFIGMPNGAKAVCYH
jgi:hypothetical protein